MNFDQLIQVSDDVIAREVAGEMVLLDLASGVYFGLDGVGSRIWSRIAKSPCSLAELCDMIEAEFDAPRDQIEADMRALVAQLAEKQLISPITD
jgi:Coenzyme PQQ synthesis protein D (PqqD)